MTRQVDDFLRRPRLGGNETGRGVSCEAMLYAGLGYGFHFVYLPLLGLYLEFVGRMGGISAVGAGYGGGAFPGEEGLMIGGMPAGRMALNRPAQQTGMISGMISGMFGVGGSATPGAGGPTNPDFSTTAPETLYSSLQRQAPNHSVFLKCAALDLLFRHPVSVFKSVLENIGSSGRSEVSAFNVFLANHSLRTFFSDISLFATGIA